MSFLFYFFIFIFLFLCALLSFVILIQESKSMGLGASFGGDSGTSLFGTSTAAVLRSSPPLSSSSFYGFVSHSLLLELFFGLIYSNSSSSDRKG